MLKSATASAQSAPAVSFAGQEIRRQAVFRCLDCHHEGLPRRYSINPWRWYHFLAMWLFFPFGLLYVLSSTGVTKECEACRSHNLKRIGYENLPYTPPTDQITVSNSRSRKIAIAMTCLLLILGLIISALEEPAEDTPTESSTTHTQETTTDQDVVLAADYNEGYKAGYADGRSTQGQIGDSYSPPATQERASSYAAGYLAGFDLGCNEGGFPNCAEIQRALSGQGITTAD
jgi:hypothetical protein